MCFCIIGKGQTTANLIIDSVNVVFKDGTSFPYWLKSGQTLNIGPNTASISVLEFVIDTANGNNLKFSQTLSIKSSSKVPQQRTWKIEAVSYIDNTMVGTVPSQLKATSPAIFSSVGSYSWRVPSGISRVCIEVWGSGGNGATGNFSVGGGGGGGGGGYGYSCFTLQPGSSHTIIVGGTGFNSSFDGTLLYSTSGSNGSVPNGGSGGTSNGQLLVMNGSSGSMGNPLPYPGWFGGSMGGGNGGNGANGGSGGIGGQGQFGTNSPATAGSAPGGGGGGGGAFIGNYSNNNPGASGGAGRIVIHW